MIVQPDCGKYSVTRPGGYSLEDDLYLTGACLPTGGRIATYCLLLCMFLPGVFAGWFSIYTFWAKTRDFTFLKKVTSQTLLIFTLSSTGFALTYFFFLMRPHPSIAPIIMSLSSTLGQTGLYSSSESWFQSLEGTKGSEDMTSKVLMELRTRARLVIGLGGLASIIGHTIATSGLAIFDTIPPSELLEASNADNGSLGNLSAAAVAYKLTVAGMTIVHICNTITILILTIYIKKYGFMLADMITETVKKMGGAAKGTAPDAGVGAKPKTAYEKMEERAAEVRIFAGKTTPRTSLYVGSINLALGLWGVASLGSPQGAGYSFWLISIKSFLNAMGALQGINMFGLSMLKKEREKKAEADASARRPSAAPSSAAAQHERQKSIAAANKRDSMHEESAVQKSARVSKDAGSKLGVPETAGSPTTTKTLVPLAEEPKADSEEKGKGSASDKVEEAAPALVETPPEVAPEPAPEPTPEPAPAPPTLSPETREGLPLLSSPHRQTRTSTQKETGPRKLV